MSSSVLKKKIISRDASVVVIGLGYVGLPLAMSFVKGGFSVIGLDTSHERVDRLKNKVSYISDVPSKQLAQAVEKKHFLPTTDASVLNDADVIILCVPTPLKRKYTPDISFILGAIKTVKKYYQKDTLIVLESTTYPGTTEELIQPKLEKKGLSLGRDYYLAFSPERIDPGNKKYPVTKIPKVVGGMTETCTALTQLLYEQIIDTVHPVSSPRAAEMTKLLENSFRIINIGWINEMAQVCHRMGVDIWEVIEAAKTKPFGFMPFYPGLGVGGHCIPDDPLYLFWKAKKYGFNSKFIKLSADTNHAMPAFVTGRIAEALSKPLSESSVLVLGVTYKKDVHDLRKSPSIQLMTTLQKQKASVWYYDPLIPYVDVDGLKVDAVALTSAKIKEFDMVVVAVDHSKVDYDLVYRSAKMIFDIKNVYGDKKTNKKLIRL